VRKFIRPNWKKNLLNISATLAEFLGVENVNPILPKLKRELDKGYKNVICICWDGMGMVPLRYHLNKNDFLRANIRQVLTSTFPSSTATATTTLTSNMMPLEHGWLAWSLYFEDIKRNMDLYKKRDSQTKEPIEYKLPLYDNSLCFFDKANSDYEINVVAPSYFDTKSVDKKIVIENEVELCDQVENICKKPGKQFVYAYYSYPDSVMHQYGMSSAEAGEMIRYINCRMQKIYDNYDDTLLVITSDHGHIDIQGYVEFYKDKELNDMLEYVPYLDSRGVSFRVKMGKHAEFERLFKKRYRRDFVLYKSQKLIKKGIFGTRGEYGYLLGDYIALGTNTYKQALVDENQKRHKGHHSGMTQEMLIPLILAGKK